MSNIPNICKNCTGNIDLKEHDRHVRAELIDKLKKEVLNLYPLPRWMMLEYLESLKE